MFAKKGVYFDYGDNERLAGKMQFHYRLSFDSEGIPMMYVFENCVNFIRTIPALIYDSVNVEDIDSSGEDHIYDCVRYVLMENLINPRVTDASMAGFEDPLNITLSDNTFDKYNFYRI